MKIKKTTPLFLTGALLASSLGATLYAQGQHDDKTHDAAPPKMGMMHDKMGAHHGKMMADMKAADDRLDALVVKMNAAKGNAKVEAMAAVLNEMVAQRKMMRGQMMAMHEQMMGGMMGKPDAKPNARPDEHSQHH